MTKQHLKYLRNDAIEDITANRIREYEAKVGATVALPVPVEEIVEQVLGLDFDWDVIEEKPGEQILGGLDVVNRKILINEAHSDLFEEKPGLLRSTIGHEAGHWDLDVDRSKLGQPMLPGIEVAPCMAKRHACKAERLIEVLFTKAMTDERAYRAYKNLTAGQDFARGQERRGPLPIGVAHAEMADPGGGPAVRLPEVALPVRAGQGGGGEHYQPDRAVAAARVDLPAGRGQDDLSERGRNYRAEEPILRLSRRP